MMNIKQAKDTIENTVRLYLKKDEFGEYRIPVVRQRPIFLLGAPGIGKTAIMEQIAEDLSIALVSYSMTHHTRQSALGLPMIAHREYEGMQYDVSEYTMSEIIASIYEVMQESGVKEGILFLDEINCVSETLSPSMLQFLQYKVFGRHQVPEGWVIVTAGNPPEYNKSVREFDVVTMDRLKVLSVDADYPVWKEYAREKGLHAAILNFLELKKEYFYKIETTVNGRSYVTARGWEDLSEILTLYEEEQIQVDEALIGQYLRNERVVREFAAYYDLFHKYKKEYQVEEILNGTISEQIVERARLAAFDERISLLGMLTDRILSEMTEQIELTDYLAELAKSLKAIGAAIESGKASAKELLIGLAEQKKKQMLAMQKAGNLSEKQKRKSKRIVRFLEETARELLQISAQDQQFPYVKTKFNNETTCMKADTQQVSERLQHIFDFVENAFAKGTEQGNEMLLFMTELTVNQSGAAFIARFGSEAYHRHSDQMQLSSRQLVLQQEIENLNLLGGNDEN